MSVSTKKPSLKATVYDKRGRILSTATNSYIKTHPLQAHYAHKVGKDKSIFLHAEIAAIVKVRNGIPYKIKVERYNSEGKPMAAKPCSICQEAIRVAGIHFIEFTI